MASGPIHQSFTAALDRLVEEIKPDRSILAAILCGSLSHDTVWARSDIDLVLVTIDDKQIAASQQVSLYADGINVHAWLLPRAAFRRTVEGSAHNSFFHAFLAKGRLLYSHDRTIDDLCARLHEIGERDTRIQLLRAATDALPALDKAHKWMVTRRDLDYTALWILHAANGLARIEIVGRRQLADREVIPQALALNPALFKVVYTDLLNAKKTVKQVQAALDAADEYVRSRARSLFGLVIDYLRDEGSLRSSTELETYFTRHYDVSGVTLACEYLAAERIIGKASTPIRLTKRSTVDAQELAFFYVESADGR
jgi:uncharacterized protein